MNAFVIDSVSGSSGSGFAGIGHIDLFNWFLGGGFGLAATWIAAAALKGGF